MTYTTPNPSMPQRSTQAEVETALKSLEALNGPLKKTQWATFSQYFDYLVGKVFFYESNDAVYQQVMGGASLRDLQTTLASLSSQQVALQQDITLKQSMLHEAEEQIVLQEVDYLEFDNPAQTILKFEQRLKHIDSERKELVKTKKAIEGNMQGFSFNNSAKEGLKFTKDFYDLMLSYYHQIRENQILKLKGSGRLETALSTLNKAEVKIRSLGSMMSLHINPRYHRLCQDELRISFEYKEFLAVQKELEKEQREQLREEEKVRKEAEKAQLQIENEQKALLAQLEQARVAKLTYEQEHMKNVIGRLEQDTEQDAKQQAIIDELQKRLAELEDSKKKTSDAISNARAGYVYVISNIGSFGESVVKIGLTRRLNPEDRVKELSSASVPFRFDVHALHFSNDAVALENALHRHFRDRAVNKVNFRKEFFYASPLEVKQAMTTLSNGALLEYHDRAEAPEYRQSIIALHPTDIKAPTPPVTAVVGTTEALPPVSAPVLPLPSTTPSPVVAPVPAPAPATPSLPVTRKALRGVSRDTASSSREDDNEFWN